MDWLDSKYSLLVSGQLERFRRVKDNFNFRCPICNDSQKSKSKARGWILTGKDNKTRFYCHNCSASLPFSKFLEQVSPGLYMDYRKEKIQEKRLGKANVIGVEPEYKSEPVKFSGDAFKGLKKISQLDVQHPAKQFISNRLIPSEFHYKIFYCSKFKEWVNKLIPGKFTEQSLKFEESRIVIPFHDGKGKLIGFQGRTLLGQDTVRYITIMLDEDAPKMFGLDSINPNKRVYLLEGPFDSMFLPNSLASAGGRLDSNLDLISISKSNIIVVYDNEPRNREIIRQMERAIDNDMNIVVWPDYVHEKDINDMVLAGRSSADIKRIIDTHYYKGLRAKLELTKWKKV